LLPLFFILIWGKDNQNQIKKEKRMKKLVDIADAVVLGVCSIALFGFMFGIRYYDSKKKRQDIYECWTQAPVVEYISANSRKDYAYVCAALLNFEQWKKDVELRYFEPYKDFAREVCEKDLREINQNDQDQQGQEIKRIRSVASLEDCLREKAPAIQR
jgi:hypothetical protein